MLDRPNLETANDPHPVQQECCIDVGGTAFSFTVYLPRYVAEKLTKDDWVAAGQQLRKERDRHVTNAVFAGTYFSVPGMQDVRDRVRRSMCDLLYERFTNYQIQAGHEQWAVPETLQGAPSCIR